MARLECAVILPERSATVNQTADAEGCGNSVSVGWLVKYEVWSGHPATRCFIVSIRSPRGDEEWREPMLTLPRTAALNCRRSSLPPLSANIRADRHGQPNSPASLETRIDPVLRILILPAARPSREELLRPGRNCLNVSKRENTGLGQHDSSAVRVGRPIRQACVREDAGTVLTRTHR
jgi:hypothetical protein